MMHPAKRFGLLESEEHMGTAGGDQRRINPFAEPDMAGNHAAALSHAVDFTLFHIHPGFESRARKQFAGQKNALTSHADDQHIKNFIVHDWISFF